MVLKILKGMFSFHSWEGNPWLTGSMNFSGLKYTFQIDKCNTVVKRSIVTSWKDRFVWFKTHFSRTERYYCVEEIDSIHRGRMVFISFMGGKPLINGNPKIVWFKTNSFISFIPGKPLINGNPKFVWFKTHFLGRER